MAFSSYATNLVAGDTNELSDIFVHDRQSGATERVSVATGGAQGNGWSNTPAISGDGRYICFTSTAPDLVTGDTNDFEDAFVHDLQSGTTERMSVATGDAQGDGDSRFAAFSPDGRVVAFESVASNLVTGDTNAHFDYFLRDRMFGTTERVSVASDGSQGYENSWGPSLSLSADGRHVGFSSLASNVVAGDTNGLYDVFVRDRGGEIGTKYCTANANSTGAPADIFAAGSASSTAGDLALASSPVPNQFGMFFHGANQSQIPFGNGFLCATGGIIRGDVIQASGNLATYVYDNSDAKHSVAAFVNTTRYFQYWFRDPMGGGALFSTSNAISIAIVP